jgi:4-hydroxy-tetrahydrodipicolinate reductase
MGRAVAAALERRGHRVSALLGREDGLDAAAGADVAFEFTVATSAPDHVGWLLGMGVPTVCGTTGWDAAPLRAWADERRVPFLVEPNFSLGVAVMRRLVREAAARLLTLEEYDAGVFERHHNKKRMRRRVRRWRSRRSPGRPADARCRRWRSASVSNPASTRCSSRGPTRASS